MSDPTAHPAMLLDEIRLLRNEIDALRADLCGQARETREHRNRLQDAVRLLLDASWNGPIDADHPARAKAVAALANIKGSRAEERE